MRVAYLINQYPKVSHSFIRREILALERQGVDIFRIAVRGWAGEIVDDEDATERQKTRYALRDGVLPLIAATVRVFLTKPVGFLRACRLCWRMGRLGDRPFPVHSVYLAEACRIALWLRSEKVEHLHAHFGTNSAEVAMIVNVLGGPKWSFTVHGPEEFDKPHSIGLEDKIRRAKFVVAISSFGRSQLYRLTDHRNWPKIHVVHCGLEPVFTTAACSPPSARRLICVGRLCEQKGQLLLMEAVHQLAKSGTDFELVFAGDGELRTEIEALIERYDLKDKVRITGWLSGNQVRDEIIAARALVLPSFAEGLPVVLMEAMALRRPVISTYVAGIPELVVPGEHGWLVPAGDVGELARAMQLCLNASVAELDRMGTEANMRAVHRHSSDKEAAKLLALFSESLDTADLS